jgi:uncharacterized membrane protein YoaK (UPF0700 family)
MNQERKPETNPSKSAVALVLTFVAGSVDGIGYLTLHHVFTAHVSGTTAHLGIDLASRRWSEAAIAASVVGAFLLGSILGRIIIEVGAQIQFRRIASMTLAIEALLLVTFVVATGRDLKGDAPISAARICWLLALLGAAMGLQTATLTRVGPLTVHTTFVTGMLNKLAQLVSHLLFETHELLRAGPGRRAHLRELRKTSASQATFIAGIWILYLLGAIVGAVLEMRVGLPALYVGVILLGCAIMIDGFRPLSVEEERDQSER